MSLIVVLNKTRGLVFCDVNGEKICMEGEDSMDGMESVTSIGTVFEF